MLIITLINEIYEIIIESLIYKDTIIKIKKYVNIDSIIIREIDIIKL